jgi:hypothetical protein
MKERNVRESAKNKIESFKHKERKEGEDGRIRSRKHKKLAAAERQISKPFMNLTLYLKISLKQNEIRKKKVERADFPRKRKRRNDPPFGPLSRH